MKKRMALLIISSLLITLPSWAVCPSMTTNPAREIQSMMDKLKEFLSQQWQDLIQDSEDKVKEVQSGNRDCSKSPLNTQALKITAYEYLREEVLSKKTDEADEYLPRTRDYAAARNLIKDKFFVRQTEQLTEKGERLKKWNSFDATMLSGLPTTVQALETLIRRDDYANAVASKNLEISSNLREKVLEDIASTKDAATEGCNQLQGMVLENRNLAALVAETASDIIVQILAMESLAARNLQKEGIELIPLPKKPDYEQSK